MRTLGEGAEQQLRLREFFSGTGHIRPKTLSHSYMGWEFPLDQAGLGSSFNLSTEFRPASQTPQRAPLRARRAKQGRFAAPSVRIWVPRLKRSVIAGGQPDADGLSRQNPGDKHRCCEFNWRR